MTQNGYTFIWQHATNLVEFSVTTLVLQKFSKTTRRGLPRPAQYPNNLRSTSSSGSVLFRVLTPLLNKYPFKTPFSALFIPRSVPQCPIWSERDDNQIYSKSSVSTSPETTSLDEYHMYLHFGKLAVAQMNFFKSPGFCTPTQYEDPQCPRAGLIYDLGDPMIVSTFCFRGSC